MSEPKRTIIDCYTDEPAGLGVPPFVGVYPRMAAGWFSQMPTYLTIDDVRLAAISARIKPRTFDPPHTCTRIDLINHTRKQLEARELLAESDELYIICGVQTPGKYLRAVPGTLAEIVKLLKPYKGKKILTGPAAVYGTQAHGGYRAEQAEEFNFDQVRPIKYANYDDYQAWMLRGAGIVRQIPWQVVAELETGRGCPRAPGCSFCTEPLKGKTLWRGAELIERESAALMENGVKWLRLGKQSCIYSYQGGDCTQIEDMLSRIKDLGPEIFHIDNVNPAMVNEARTELFCKYLTAGSTAAMGVESFDEDVCKLNHLNSRPEITLRAIRIINRFGGDMDEAGRYKLLPGINLLLGLDGESPRTLERNFESLQGIYDEGLLLRRINIRQVVPFPGTALYLQAGNRFLKRNRGYYMEWSKRVRVEIDRAMLKRLYPEGTVLKELLCESHAGQMTYGRQGGSYPIIVGVPERLELGRWIDIEVVGYRARSLIGKVVGEG